MNFSKLHSLEQTVRLFEINRHIRIMSFHQSYKLHPFEPTNYVGGKLDASWKCSIYQSCMGGILEETNFKVFLERLGGESPTVAVHRVGFSGDGWYEFVAIHESDTKSIALANKMLASIRAYPVLDDDRFTQAEEDYYTSIGYVQDENGEWEPAGPVQSETPNA